MKKLLCILSAVLLIVGLALAEDYTGYMRVVNCNEWVSLREKPSKSADRLDKVPLNDIVWCSRSVKNGFVAAMYADEFGYILKEYLEPLTDHESIDIFMGYAEMTWDYMLSDADMVLDTQVGGYRIVACRSWETGFEELRVGCCVNDEFIWSRVIAEGPPADLYGTSVFIGGTAQNPAVMLYSVRLGLVSVAPDSGLVNWYLKENLGGDITSAVDTDGTMYIAGFYGPDPVAVSAEGKLLWSSDCGDEDIYWPYQIRVFEDSIVTDYDSGNEDGHYVVCYDKTGKKLWSDMALYKPD